MTAELVEQVSKRDQLESEVPQKTTPHGDGSWELYTPGPQEISSGKEVVIGIFRLWIFHPVVTIASWELDMERTKKRSACRM